METLQATSLPFTKEFFSKIAPKSNSISAIIRSYKSVVTSHANRLKLEMAWQERFHDLIIRNKHSYNKINNYIITNPENWKDDKFWS